MARRSSSILSDNLAAAAVVGVTVAFVLWQQKQKKSPTINGVVGVSRNPKHLRPGDIEGYQRFTTLPVQERQQIVSLMNPYEKAELQATLNRAAQYLRKKRIKVGGLSTAPGVIGSARRGKFGERWTESFDRKTLQVGDRVRYGSGFKKLTGTVTARTGESLTLQGHGQASSRLDTDVSIWRVQKLDIGNRNLIGHTAPGVIGCDCGSEF